MGLPFGQLAIDGKATAIDAWDDRYGQRQRHSAGAGAHGLVRTLTASLVSSRASVCLDAAPIPPATNEGGRFPSALRELTAAYGSLQLFSLISADAGMCTLANADAVRHHHLHYLLGLKQDQPTLLAEAMRLLQHRRKPVAETVDVAGNKTVTRQLFLTEEMAQFNDWDHLQTVLRVQAVTRDDTTGELSKQNRYFICSLPIDALTAEQWLRVVRNHWGVENHCHNSWDKILREDDHPWIVAGHGACQAVVNVMLLRRLAYNLLALFRSVTQRGELQRQTPYKVLMRWIYNTLIAAQASHTAGLRPRLRATVLS